jgi:hypothetical protein
MMRRSSGCILSHAKAHNAATNSHQNSHRKANEKRTKISTYGGAADFRSSEGEGIPIDRNLTVLSSLLYAHFRVELEPPIER